MSSTSLGSRRTKPSASEALTATMLFLGEQRDPDPGADLLRKHLGGTDLRVVRGPEVGEALLGAIIGGDSARRALDDLMAAGDLDQAVGRVQRHRSGVRG